MRKNPSLPQFKGINTLNMTMSSPMKLSTTNNKSPTSSNMHKKLQGYDMSSTLKPSSYTSQIQQLKSRPNKQSIEDQYIKGLQDEIHYLEMQLKLLQEKDQAKHGQIDQLEKFFSDGVPINENILAIKNGFNNYKNEKEKSIKELVSEKKERETLIEGLSKRIKEMEQQLEKEEKDIRVFEAGKTSEMHQLLKQQAKLKKQLQLQDEQLKNLKLANRKLSEKLTSLQRNKQIQMVMTLKNQNHKMDKLSKIKDSIIQKQAEYEELEKQYEELVKEQEEKSFVIKIEEDNLALKKKLISMERELNALQTKAQQKQMQLDSKLKERHKEISSKTQMKMRLQNQRAKINRENSMRVEDIEKVAKEKEIILLQKIIAENKKLSKYTGYYEKLLLKAQDEIQKMVEKKPQLKNEINAYSAQVKRQTEMLHQERQRQSQLFSEIIQAQARVQHYQSVSSPLLQTISKTQQQIKMYRNEKQQLTSDIKVKQKQLQLILILKSLNLEQVQMSKSSASNIQDKLVGFIRNWELLQRNA